MNKKSRLHMFSIPNILLIGKWWGEHLKKNPPIEDKWKWFHRDIQEILDQNL